MPSPEREQRAADPKELRAEHRTRLVAAFAGLAAVFEQADQFEGLLQEVLTELRKLPTAVADAVARVIAARPAAPAPPASVAPAAKPPKERRAPKSSRAASGPHGPWTFHGDVRMKRRDGEAIRRDVRKRMPRKDIYQKWAKPSGKYTRTQVAAALAWANGKLKGRAKARPRRRREAAHAKGT